MPKKVLTPPSAKAKDVAANGAPERGALDADIIIANAPDPVFVSDLEGKILQANDAVSQLLGFRRDEVVEQSLSRFISAEETREFTAALKEVVEHGVTRDAVLNPRSASGEVIPTSLNASALRDSEGNVIGAIGVLRDMRELDKARAYAESLIKNAPDPVFVSDLEGKIVEANDAVAELLGLRRDEVLEQSVSRFIDEEETREFTAALREVVERGVTRNARLNPRSASGEIIPTTLNASALRDNEGNVIGAIGVLRDMRELDKARAYSESLIENAPDPVFVSDLEGKILQANVAVSQLLGFRKDEVVEQSLSRFISPEETLEFTAAVREVVERGVTRNARLNPRSASGEIIPTTLNASALRDADGNVIGAIGILRDMRAYEEVVSDLERSKTELQEKILDLEKFEEVVVGRELKMIALEKELESLQAEVAKTRPESSSELMAAEPEALPPLGNGEAFAPTEPDPEHLQQQVEDLQLRVRRAEERRRALLHIMGDLNESNRKLGEQRKAMLHILADYEQDRSSLAQHTERLDNSRRALLNILKDSHESNLRLGDTRKAMIHIMGDLRETTQAVERREQELRDKQEQLVQAAKLATLGELTTGVAHELNNPLNNIGLFVGNVIDRMVLGEVDAERVVSDLEKAMDQVRKATEIITHLRTFGRAAPISLEPVAVGEILERALSLMNEQLRVRLIEVEVEPAPDELVVLGNAIQLEQVFINLLTNARDALADAPEQDDPTRFCPDEGRPGENHGLRQRPGHPTGARAAHLRSVLHDQGGRDGDRPRPLDHLRHRQGARRLDRGHERSRRGCVLRDRAAAWPATCPKRSRCCERGPDPDRRRRRGPARGAARTRSRCE